MSIILYRKNGKGELVQLTEEEVQEKVAKGIANAEAKAEADAKEADIILAKADIKANTLVQNLKKKTMTEIVDYVNTATAGMDEDVRKVLRSLAVISVYMLKKEED